MLYVSIFTFKIKNANTNGPCSKCVIILSINVCVTLFGDVILKDKDTKEERS